MKILIINAEAGGNKGAEAMLETVIKQIISKNKEVHIYAEVTNKESNKYYEEYFLNKFKEFNVFKIQFNAKRFLMPYGNDVPFFDKVIDIGGINFHGSSKRSLLRSFIRYRNFIFSKSDLVFFTQDSGPTNDILIKFFGKICYNNSISVFARSKFSKNELLNTFKVNSNMILGPFPDSTLLYEPTPLDFGANNFTNSPYVVISPSAIMFNKYGDLYISLFVKLISNLITKFQIVLLVNNFTKNGNSSDIEVARKLKSKFPDSILLDKSIPASELKFVLKNSSFCVTSRYHVLVGSISSNVPAIAVGWNPKYESFLSLYNKRNWSVDFSDNSFNEISNIISSFNEIDNKLELKDKNNILKNDVNLSFSKLFELLEL